MLAILDRLAKAGRCSPHRYRFGGAFFYPAWMSWAFAYVPHPLGLGKAAWTSFVPRAFHNRSRIFQKL